MMIHVEMRRTRSAQGRRAGFTLIELLVVIAVIGVLVSLLSAASLIRRERLRANRASVTDWLISAYQATVQAAAASNRPFHYATDLPANLLSRVQRDPNNANHLIGWGYDIYYSAPRRPAPEFTWEARPHEPGLTGTTRIVYSYPQQASAASASFRASGKLAVQSEGAALVEDDVVGWEEEVPGWQEAQAEAFRKSTIEALKMVGELAGWLAPEERKTAFYMMTSEDGRNAAIFVLDRNSDGIITLDELCSHPDAIVHETLQRIVVGPWKLGVAGEKLEEIGVSVDDIDIGVPFPTYGDLCDLYKSFVDAKKSAASFCAKLHAAAAAEKRGQPRVAVNQLNAAKNQVRAESGKTIDRSEAGIVQTLLDLFIAHLKGG